MNATSSPVVMLSSQNASGLYVCFVFWLYTCTIAFVGDTNWFLFGYKYKLKAVKANSIC